MTALEVKDIANGQIHHARTAAVQGYSKANLWLTEPDDDPEHFEPDFPDDAAFQMSAECPGEYDDEVSSRW